jgi:AraC-like DNA-binding protein
VPASLVSASLSGYFRQDYPLQRLLEHASLEQHALEEGKRLSLNQFGRVLQSTYALMDDEGSGFLPRRLPPGTFAMMCHATISCPNLRRLFLRCGQFLRIVNSDIRFEIIEQGEEARLVLHLKGRDGVDTRFLEISLFIIIIRWSGWLLDKPIMMERADFAFDPPDYADEFDAMFPCRHYFGQRETAVVISSHYLNQPVVQTPQSLTDFLTHAPECLLTHYKSDSSIAAQIRKLLQQGDDSMGFQQIADALHMSAPTLRRRLRDEHTSFQTLKDSVRRDMAIYHLRQPHLAISEIAEMMGFSETSPFNRAFKKWTGTTPGAYREALQDQ